MNTHWLAIIIFVFAGTILLLESAVLLAIPFFVLAAVFLVWGLIKLSAMMVGLAIIIFWLMEIGLADAVAVLLLLLLLV